MKFAKLITKAKKVTKTTNDKKKKYHSKADLTRLNQLKNKVKLLDSGINKLERELRKGVSEIYKKCKVNTLDLYISKIHKSELAKVNDQIQQLIKTKQQKVIELKHSIGFTGADQLVVDQYCNKHKC